MTYKEQISKQITAAIKGIGRQVTVDDFLDLKVDQIITAEKAESWSDHGEFMMENSYAIDYCFVCNNACPVHEVDYENEEECYELDAEDCESEKEVLVPAGTKFKVTSIGSEHDLEEMGFILVEVEYVG